MIPEPTEADLGRDAVWEYDHGDGNELGWIRRAAERWCVMSPEDDPRNEDEIDRVQYLEWENNQLRERLVAAERERDEAKAQIDPPICRLQFPDGSVPGNAREAAEGWKRVADAARAELAEIKATILVYRESGQVTADNFHAVLQSRDAAISALAAERERTKRLREALERVSRVSMMLGRKDSSYPTCPACHERTFGPYAIRHKDDCYIKAALAAAPAAPETEAGK